MTSAGGLSALGSILASAAIVTRDCDVARAHHEEAGGLQASQSSAAARAFSSVAGLCGRLCPRAGGDAWVAVSTPPSCRWGLKGLRCTGDLCPARPQRRPASVERHVWLSSAVKPDGRWRK